MVAMALFGSYRTPLAAVEPHAESFLSEVFSLGMRGGAVGRCTTAP